MFEPFIIRALIVGIAVAVIAGSVGCFVLWNKMAYFGDALSHSALLGIAFGLAININLYLGIIIICLAFALLLLALQTNKRISVDAILGILSHSALSISLVFIGLWQQRTDIYSYLFGDILSVTQFDIYIVYVSLVIVVILLKVYWVPLIITTINQDLAKAYNINTTFINLLIIALITIIIAASIQIVGVLLITSLLIIPSSTARIISKSPVSMVLQSIILAVLSVVLGLIISILLDLTSGPAIVVTEAMLFAMILIYTKLYSIMLEKKKRKHLLTS